MWRTLKARAEVARALRPLAVSLVVLLLAGCTGAPAPHTPPTTPVIPDVPEMKLFALDGRWPIDIARAETLLAKANVPSLGSLVFAEAMGDRVLDVVGIDADAALALGIEVPAPGEVFVTRSLGRAVGDELALRSHAWPTPYVATYFEMERTPECASRPDTKLCLLPKIREGEARLRLRVDPGARDAAFLPDLVELGAGGRPAYWNGTFEGPEGEHVPFSAVASLEGEIRAGELVGPMTTGDWNVTFRIETAGRLAAAGAAGIVRVREPGYLWFDDRLQQVPDPAAQARAIVANATPTSVTLRVARVVDAMPLGADVLVSFEDARALAGRIDATALLVNLTPSQEDEIADHRGPDGLTYALRARPLPYAQGARISDGPLVFAAPYDIDLAALPSIEGAGPPELALAARPPVGEPLRIDGEEHHGILWLAHAAGAPTWGLPTGGRWERTDEALENLSRSRTLALGSPDLVAGAIATARIEMGSGTAMRSIVAIGGVTGGPDTTLWTSAALISGSMRPAAPRVILPIDDGADRADVLSRARDAWAPFGLAFDR